MEDEFVHPAGESIFHWFPKRLSLLHVFSGFIISVASFASLGVKKEPNYHGKFARVNLRIQLELGNDYHSDSITDITVKDWDL